MSDIVLDTDVLSFIAKADSRAALYSGAVIGQRLCVCFQTVAELQLWMIVRRWGAPRRQAMSSLLNRFVVLPYDSAMAQRWTEITANRRQIGRPIDCGDAWIAASALRHSASLVTHNSKDYVGIPGLKVISHGR